MMRKDQIIEIKEEVSIGDVVLEPRDKIKILKEASKIYGWINDYPKVKNKISTLGQMLDWDIEGAMTLCLHILEEVNAHTLMSKVEKVFEEEVKTWK